MTRSLGRFLRYQLPGAPGAAGALATIFLFMSAAAAAAADMSTTIAGPQRMLVVPVRFPGTTPRIAPEQIEEKISRVDQYIRQSSYDKAWLETTLVPWYDMPAGLDAYKVSPYNHKVDPERVRRLVVDALNAARRDTDLAKVDLVWILVGAFTRPGEGYGMVCYAANPGMLSKNAGRGEFRPKLETINLADDISFAKPVTVSSENALVGHVVHDLLHALGGVRQGRRVLPDLYDFRLQSNPPAGQMLPEVFAIHTGPWDIMSQHFIDRTQPPPAPSSFTRLRLGWIAPEQVVRVTAGETREVALSPLASGRDKLVVRVALTDDRYLLIENRQRSGGDAIQRSAGMLVLEVDPSRAEGTAIVRAADANPGIPRLYAAPFLPRQGERAYYENTAANVAAVPLDLADDGALRVLVTTPEHARQMHPR